MRLHELPPRRVATILTIEWSTLTDAAGRRLRELGFDEGVAVELLHRAPLGSDPIACRVGRMTVALRSAQAAAVQVALEAAAE